MIKKIQIFMEYACQESIYAKKEICPKMLVARFWTDSDDMRIMTSNQKMKDDSLGVQRSAHVSPAILLVSLQMQTILATRVT